MHLRLLALLATFALLLAACGTTDDPAAVDPGVDETTPEPEPEDEPEDEVVEEATEPDDFPSEPITLISVFPAGGAHDLILRLLAPKLSEDLGVPVGVEVVEGGSGVVGLTEAYQREADGYTLVSYSPPGEYLSQLQDQLSGFTVDDFVMLAGVNVDPGAVAVPMDSPYETLEQLNEAAASEELTAATTGLTSNTAVGAYSYMARSGVEFSLVPFTGAELTAAVLGGHTDLGFRAGGWYDLHGEELRVLAVTHHERVDEFPDVPTVGEIIGEDVIFSSLRGLAVRADTPQERQDILADALERVANDPEIRDTMLDTTGFRWEYLDRQEAADMTQMFMDDVDEVVAIRGLGE